MPYVYKDRTGLLARYFDSLHSSPGERIDHRPYRRLCYAENQDLRKALALSYGFRNRQRLPISNRIAVTPGLVQQWTSEKGGSRWRRLREAVEQGDARRGGMGVALQTPVFTIVLLLSAVLLGAHYRFHNLQRWEMNDAEGSTWAAVVAPNVCKVVQTFWQVEAGGKHPVYDLVLHEWVGVFGASLSAMRAMSAVLGTIAIVLLFFAVREVYCALDGEAAAQMGEMAGAFAALIYAVNVTLLISDRTARVFLC